MKIHLYAVCWNEEVIMPFFLDHYSRFCDKIVMFDNESDDRTVEIIKSFPKTEVRTFKTAGTLDDWANANVKNGCYLESRGTADWVIVCDSDEFLYHHDLPGVLEQYTRQGITFPSVVGFDMTPAAMPCPGEYLPVAHPFGARSLYYHKRIVFNPILDVTYAAGAHSIIVSDTAQLSPTAELKLLHYRFLTKDYFLQRRQRIRPRLSANNRRYGLGIQYLLPEEKNLAEYDQAWSARQKVV